eukprot:1019946-Prorocentrum_minimum.AAC.1
MLHGKRSGTLRTNKRQTRVRGERGDGLVIRPSDRGRRTSGMVIETSRSALKVHSFCGSEFYSLGSPVFVEV